MSDTVSREEIQKWIDLLRSSVSLDRLEGATELASFAVRRRGAVRTRGSVSRAAKSRLPRGVNLTKSVLEAFDDEHLEVRRAVALVLGEIGDEKAVKILRQRLKDDRDSTVRGESADALGKIGGPAAVEALKAAAQEDRAVEVRIRAIRALADLASKEATPDPRVTELMRTLQRKDLDELVRERAAAALKQLEPAEAEQE